MARKVSSATPKLDPSNVTEYEPATDPESGLAEEIVGEEYENIWERVLDPAPSEMATSLLTPKPEGARTRNEESETHFDFAIAEVDPIPGTAEESTNPK
jgi:hypothetical protein